MDESLTSYSPFVQLAPCFTREQISHTTKYSCEGHIFAAMCLLGGGGVGHSQVYFLQLYVDLDGNHKNFKNHQNEKAQGKI